MASAGISNKQTFIILHLLSINETFNLQISDILVITKSVVQNSHGPISGMVVAFASYYCGDHHISQ